jgi:hypothetical protein
MELAGLACAQTLAKVYAKETYPRVLVCCGPGNQGNCRPQRKLLAPQRAQLLVLFYQVEMDWLLLDILVGCLVVIISLCLICSSMIRHVRL